MKFNRMMEVTSPNDNAEGVPGIDFSPDGHQILAAYPCKIKDKPKYSTKDTGDDYEGTATLYGALTDKLEKGMLLDGQYKIITKPQILKRCLKAKLARL